MVTSIYTGLDSMGIKKKESTRMAGFLLHSRILLPTLATGVPRYNRTRTANALYRSSWKKFAERRQKDLIRPERRRIRMGKLILAQSDRIRFFSPWMRLLRKASYRPHLARPGLQGLKSSSGNVTRW